MYTPEVTEKMRSCIMPAALNRAGMRIQPAQHATDEQSGERKQKYAQGAEKQQRIAPLVGEVTCSNRQEKEKNSTPL